MDQKDYLMCQNQQKMGFPTQSNNQLGANPFTSYKACGQEKIKFQNNNQLTYNFFDFQLKRNNPNHPQPTPDYDLFDIEKKRKKQKYKRSTNNSHKKFISAIRRLFYAVISTHQKEEFETKYRKFKSCRTFFFIILAYMKSRFSDKLLNSVRVSFINQMKIKINQYQQEISRTKNMNLKNFREEEIIDIKYSIKSCNEYFSDNTREAIQCMYKKDKSTVVKRQHYESALRSVHMIEKQLNQNPKSLLQSPYIQDYSPSSDRQKAEKKVIKRQIRQNQIAKFALQQQQNFDFGNSFQKLHDPFNFSKKQLRTTNDTEQFQNDDFAQKQLSPAKNVLYPPFLEAVPYIKYDPFTPPFKYKRETKLKVDVREDFFGYMNYGFPKFYQRNIDFFGINAGLFPVSQQQIQRI